MAVKRRPGRRSIRLPGYDYSGPGAYFVTICTRSGAMLFGTVVDGEMKLNDRGRIVEETWVWLSRQYAHVALDTYVVMPNHVHGIPIIESGQGHCGRGGPRTAPTAMTPKPLGGLIGAFKTVSTKRINLLAGTSGERIWQRNYYEHVIRDERELQRIRRYIDLNPMRWEGDRENPAAARGQSVQTNA